MDELSIRIKIADREYPMKVKREEEERVRTAAKWVNDRLKTLKDQFGTDDKQDLLAMVAFDSMVQKLAVEEKRTGVDQGAIEKVAHLNQLLAQALN
jgi:cell division protein ZapA